MTCLIAPYTVQYNTTVYWFNLLESIKTFSMNVTCWYKNWLKSVGNLFLSLADWIDCGEED
jgi:hypothetical protein